MIAVLVACFAATTLDTATRLQRYVIQELAGTLHIQPLTNKYAATALAVTLGGALAMLPAKAGAAVGTGGLILWPLFGATNQMLAGLAFLVTLFYLWRRNKPIWFIVGPTVIMLMLPIWGLAYQMFHPEFGWLVAREIPAAGDRPGRAGGAALDRGRRDAASGVRLAACWKKHCHRCHRPTIDAVAQAVATAAVPADWRRERTDP